MYSTTSGNVTPFSALYLASVRFGRNMRNTFEPNLRWNIVVYGSTSLFRNADKTRSKGCRTNRKGVIHILSPSDFLEENLIKRVVLESVHILLVTCCQGIFGFPVENPENSFPIGASYLWHIAVDG